MNCQVCGKVLGKDISGLFNGLCFEHAMEKKELKERYPQLRDTIDKCYGCHHFGETLDSIGSPVLILEELCDHPIETFPGYPSCFKEFEWYKED
jgi:hypothetical protein